MRVLALDLIASTDSYGDRLILPTGLALQGNFKHNRGTFGVDIFADSAAAAKWTGRRDDSETVGWLNARATVIAQHYTAADRPNRVQVEVGDVLHFGEHGAYEIRDDVPLHDPRLVRIS